MNFLEKILGTSKNDKLGIDSAIAGIKSLRQRLETERQKLVDVKAELRDQALKDPAGEIDEMPVIRQRERLTVLEEAMESGMAKAAAQIDARTADIDKEITALEQKREDLHRKRDLERLGAIRDFCSATGSRLSAPPAQGRGGTIQVVSVSSMSNAEVVEFFKDSPKPKQSKLGQELAAVTEEWNRLTTLKRYGARNGLETLANVQG